MQRVLQKNSQVHHQPDCEAARRPWHAPRGVSGGLILITTVLAWPRLSSGLPRHKPSTALPCGAAPSPRETTSDCRAQPAGFSPPVHRVNEVRRAIQHTPAWTDSPCCSWSCRAGIKQTRQACRQLSAKKIMKEQGGRAKPSHLDQPSGEFNFSQVPQQRSVSVPQPRPRGCCSITSVPGCPALIS